MWTFQISKKGVIYFRKNAKSRSTNFFSSWKLYWPHYSLIFENSLKWKNSIKKFLGKNGCNIRIPRPKKHRKWFMWEFFGQHLRKWKFRFSIVSANFEIRLVGFFFRVSGLKSMSNLIIVPREDHLTPPHLRFWLCPFITGG